MWVKQQMKSAIAGCFSGFLMFIEEPFIALVMKQVFICGVYSRNYPVKEALFASIKATKVLAGIASDAHVKVPSSHRPLGGLKYNT